MACSECGKKLKREQHAALPTEWFHTEGVLSVTAARNGWVAGRCRECQSGSGSGPGDSE